MFKIKKETRQTHDLIRLLSFSESKLKIGLICMNGTVNTVSSSLFFPLKVMRRLN
jgi:hypothetical protein